MPCRIPSLLVCALLLGPWPLSAEEAPVYQSHFEDSLHQAAGFTDWKLSDPPDGSAISLVPLGPEDTAAGSPAALRIECQATDAPVRASQSSDLFRLEPERPYVLRVTLRIPRLESGTKARVRFFVTDSRWQWSSPSLPVKEPQSEWHTLELPFASPAAGGPFFRIRFEALHAALQLEIAKITVAPDSTHP